jgi:hypothetical protein
MQVETRWLEEARKQFDQLPSALQDSALTLEQNLIANPYIGTYWRTIRLKNGKQAHVHAYAGLRVIVEFYRRGLFRQTTIIVIHGFRPMDMPGWEEYEERLTR